jgi:hypothetical protein
VTIKISKKYILYSAIGFFSAVILCGALYITAQSLLHKVLVTQLKRAGYADPLVSGVRIYWDGVVVKQIQPDQYTVLKDVYTDQSPPHIAQQGLQNVIVRHADYTMPSLAQWDMRFPFPHIKRISVENMRLVLDLPQQDVVLKGTVKSLQTEPGQLVLRMVYEHENEEAVLQGAVEISLINGKIDAIDLNVEDGSFQDETVALKRVSGWMNIQKETHDVIKAEAQFTAGSVFYQGVGFSDGMAQYSFASDQSAQWTITLNKPADHYFNTWVVKETQRTDRYAVQIAAQAGDQTETRTMVVIAPVQLVLLLQPPLPVVPDGQPGSQ